jgi:hypothetical protein
MSARHRKNIGWSLRASVAHWKNLWLERPFFGATFRIKYAAIESANSMSLDLGSHCLLDVPDFSA